MFRIMDFIVIITSGIVKFIKKILYHKNLAAKECKKSLTEEGSSRNILKICFFSE